MSSLYAYGSLRPSVAASAYIAPGARLIGDVRIGEQTSVWFNTVLRGDIQYVQVGRESNIQDGSVLHVDHDFPCIVGDQVTVGHGAIVHGCTIEDGVLIGMGAVILSGACIGTGSIIAAGAVVREGTVVPARSLVAGVPGRVIRTIDQDAGRTNAVAYVALADRYRRTCEALL